MKIISAVIGMGIGRKHLEAMEGFKNSKVKYIIEKNKKLRKKLKKKFPNKIVVENYKNMLQDKTINLVSIASYDNYHFSQIINCIKNDKNVIVEKPICLSIEQLKKIHKLLKSKPKLKILSNLVLRTNSLFLNIKKKIRKKKIFYMEADYLWGRKEKLYGWRSKTKNYSLILEQLFM